MYNQFFTIKPRISEKRRKQSCTSNTRFLTKEIKIELDNVHSTSAPAFTTVYNWGMNLNMVVYPHLMHLVQDIRIEAATPKIIDKVYDIDFD